MTGQVAFHPFVFHSSVCYDGGRLCYSLHSLPLAQESIVNLTLFVVCCTSHRFSSPVLLANGNTRRPQTLSLLPLQSHLFPYLKHRVFCVSKQFVSGTLYITCHPLSAVPTALVFYPVQWRLFTAAQSSQRAIAAQVLLVPTPQHPRHQ